MIDFPLFPSFTVTVAAEPTKNFCGFTIVGFLGLVAMLKYPSSALPSRNVRLYLYL